MDQMHRVFVFGTLKEGFPNFATNRGTRVPGTFRTRDAYPLYLVGDRHSPWMVDEPGQGHRVAGQIFHVDLQTLAAMDLLERIAEPDGYRRRELQLHATDSDEIVVAHAYLKPADQLVMGDVRLGPLDEYRMEHAALYRRRA